MKLEIVKRCLEQEFELKVENNAEHLYGSNDMIIALVVIPHEGNNFHYLVRFSTAAAFDRWANSRAIEKEFDTEEDVVKYLKENKLSIYKKLLEYLSREYEYLRGEFENDFENVEP